MGASNLLYAGTYLSREAPTEASKWWINVDGNSFPSILYREEVHVHINSGIVMYIYVCYCFEWGRKAGNYRWVQVSDSYLFVVLHVVGRRIS